MSSKNIKKPEDIFYFLIKANKWLIGFAYSILNMIGETVLSTKIKSDNTIVEIENLFRGLKSEFTFGK